MKWKRIAKGHYECGDYKIVRNGESKWLAEYSKKPTKAVLYPSLEKAQADIKDAVDRKSWIDANKELRKGEDEFYAPKE